MVGLRVLIERVVALLVGVLLFANAAHAQEEPYPNRPITLIVGYPAGGSADVTARVLAESASKTLGQPIVVLNKPGAGTVVELMTLKNAKPDGYTIGTLATAGMINQYMRKVDYDTTRDFTPIIQYAGWIAGVVVRNDAPWKNFTEFLAYAKANPGKIRYSTAGAGTQQHLTMVRLGNDLGINWVHIPYKGGPDAIAAVLAGDVEAAAQTAEWTPYVKDGQLRLLVTFGAKRAEAFPDAPALSEFGINFNSPNLLGLVGPAGVPQKAVDRLHEAFKKAMAEEQFLKTVAAMSMVPTYKGPEEFGKYILDLNRTWGNVIRKAMGKDN